jgi:hypothetical protein
MILYHGGKILPVFFYGLMENDLYDPPRFDTVLAPLLCTSFMTPVPL